MFPSPAPQHNPPPFAPPLVTPFGQPALTSFSATTYGPVRPPNRSSGQRVSSQRGKCAWCLQRSSPGLASETSKRPRHLSCFPKRSRNAFHPFAWQQGCLRRQRSLQRDPSTPSIGG